MIFDNSTSKMPLSVNSKNMNSLRGIPLIGASLVLSLVTGCASVDKSGQVELVDTNETTKPVASQPIPEESTLSAEESARKADQMMETLKAPLVEPEVVAKEKPVEKKSPAKVEDAEAEVQIQASEKPEVIEKMEKKIVPIEKQVELSEVKEEPAAQDNQAPAEELGSVSSVKPLPFTKKDLPATYDIWVLKQGETALTQGLVISTPTWEMGKTGYTSQIWLTLKEDEIHINSSSDIATEVKGLGIRIDDGALIPFSRIAENSIGIVEGQWLDKLARAKNLDIHLGFFPGKKPTSDNFKSNTSLDNLDRVVATYRKLSE